MSSDTAFSGIKAFIDANWLATAVRYENQDWNLPDTPTHFLFVEIFGTYFEQESLGSDPQSDNLWRERGIILCHVMTERGAGTDQARTYARQFCDLFRGNDDAGVLVERMEIGASEPGAEDGNYYRMTATLEWERDDTP